MASRCSRRAFIRGLGRLGVMGGALPLTAFVRSSASARIRRVGFIVGDEPRLVAAFTDALHGLGHVHGRNFLLETRLLGRTASNGAAMAAELARMDLDLVVAGALPFALEVRRANPAMAMVIVTCPGMVSNGFAASLERPGGNVTGMDELPPGLTAKRLTLLKSAAPTVSHVALLSTTPGRGGHEIQLADAEQAAGTLGIRVRPYRVRSLAELESALVSIDADGMDGLLNFQGGLSLLHRERIVDFAAKRRLPAMYQATLFAEAGGLMAWAPDLEEQFRTAAGYVDRILRGAQPGELRIHHPERYYLTVNAGTAARLGLTLPERFLAQADRVLH